MKEKYYNLLLDNLTVNEDLHTDFYELDIEVEEKINRKKKQKLKLILELDIKRIIILN